MLDSFADDVGYSAAPQLGRPRQRRSHGIGQLDGLCHEGHRTLVIPHGITLVKRFAHIANEGNPRGLAVFVPRPMGTAFTNNMFTKWNKAEIHAPINRRTSSSSVERPTFSSQLDSSVNAHSRM